MNLKFSKSDLKNEKKMNPAYHIHCCVIGFHANFIVEFGLNKKVSCEGLSRGGG